jgi:uncharacterized OsmC-like protein/alpha/beta superfamily hydrolase
VPTKTVQFTGADGDMLSARLELPLREPVAFALFAHCFTCTKNIKAAVNISRALAKRGIGVLRFDFTGLGESEGEFADTNFSSNVQDIVAAASYLAAEWRAPALLVGHSLGGSATLVAAGDIPSVRAVATLGAPADPGHVLHHFESSREAIERDGESEVLLAGRPFRVKRQFLEDASQQNLVALLPELDRALLIMHAPTDTTVGIENAATLYGAARHPKSFVSLDDADHLLMREADSLYAGSVLAAWAQRYIGTRDDTADSDTERPAGDRVLVETGVDHYHTSVFARTHGLVADEPIALGGEDLGPTPYELMTAGLGACTSITLRMYADRKEWPLESVQVRLNHQKEHARDTEDPEAHHAHQGRIDHLHRVIDLTGDLTLEQREQLLKIASHCPVHRTLEAGVYITTELATESTEPATEAPELAAETTER